MIKFWGTEVKPEETIFCDAETEYVTHISLAALGETKRQGEDVIVYLKFNGNRMVMGTLSAKSHPQIMYDLNMEKGFELSHSSKTASVFFMGYRTPVVDSSESECSEAEGINDDVVSPSSEDDLSLIPTSDEYMSDDDAISEADESNDENHENVVEGDKRIHEPKILKRASETDIKITLSNKKAKIATTSCKKTDDKKDGYVATFPPARQASKTSADSNPKKFPKSSGDNHQCNLCGRAFGSGVALESHQKVKHIAAK